jgi:RNA exonuclease 1
MVFCQGINVSHFGLDINKKKIPACVDLSAVDADTTGKAAMPFLTRQAKHMLVTKISGAEGRVQSPVADILQCPISNSKKLAIEQKMYDDKMKYKDNMRDYYILSLDEMKRADYPIPPFLDPSRELPEDWKETHPASEPTEKKKLIAVDCEMVLTEQGSELARLTLISEGK